MILYHNILVYIPDAIDVDEDTPREETISAVKRYAKAKTDRFFQWVYDWREVDLEDVEKENPQPVYLASDDLDGFMASLESVQRVQLHYITSALSSITSTVGTDLESIVKGLWDRKDWNFYYEPRTINGVEYICEKIADPEESHGFTKDIAYDLQTIADFLNGTYRFNSHFYNTRSCTARLDQGDMDLIRTEPDDWALVQFTYHY